MYCKLTTEDAIRCNDVGALRSILNKQYYNAEFPTMSDDRIEVLKQTIIYAGKPDLLRAFEKYRVAIP